ncbi:hypothetical protein ACLQ29_00395 [Micromonospora sp. DT228]|uniref:hypothetical protein n=1 Tax=Micromonospora sp. DT228 TaxID=3393443 RepID=UPI003CF9A4BF
MQPESPYRFTHALGASPVGKAWAAVDEQGRPRTVVLLDGPAAADPRWRDAFAYAVRMLGDAPGGSPYEEADLTAANPWVAYGDDQGDAPQRLFGLLQQEYRVENLNAPVSGPAAPVSGTPVSAVGPTEDPARGTQDALVGSTQQLALYPQVPWRAQSSPPISAVPSSGGLTPYDHEPAMAGRRIAPVRVVRKRLSWMWIAGGLALALVAGVAGYALRGSADESTSPSPSGTASLSPFKATQLSINKAKFVGDLAPIGEPWLADIGGCTVYNSAGGPPLPPDEERHISCPYGSLWLHFVLYPERPQKDLARTSRQQLNAAAGAFAPGLKGATQTTGGTTGAAGSYVEYAYKAADGQAVCALWWDRDDVDGAFFLETPCETGIGGNWEALRDVWRRYS